MYEVNLKESFTGFLLQKVNTPFERNPEDSKKIKGLKLAAEITMFSTFASVGLIELIARSCLFLVAKTIQFFIPNRNGFLQTFNQKVFHPLMAHTQKSMTAFLQSLGRIFTSILSNQSQKATSTAIRHQVEALFQSSYANAFYNAGFRRGA